MAYYTLLFFTFLTSCSVEKPKPTATFSNFKSEFLRQINSIRTSGCKCGKKNMPPVHALSWNTNLEAAALKHAVDMAKTKYFNHKSLSGKTSKQRIEESGYKSSGMRLFNVGENIAFGQRSIEEVMQSWIKSEGHCKNLMSKDYTEVGVAQTKLYWVQNFGKRIPLN